MGRDRFSRDRCIQSEEWTEIKNSVIGLPFAPGYVPEVLKKKSNFILNILTLKLNSIKSIDKLRIKNLRQRAWETYQIGLYSEAWDVYRHPNTFLTSDLISFVLITSIVDFL